MATYFFCDNTSHILTTYIITKLYLKDDQEKPIVFLTDVNPNVYNLKDNMEKLGLWKNVLIAPAYNTEEEICDYLSTFNITNQDTRYLYTYSHPVDRALYYLMQINGGKTIFTDEGGFNILSYDIFKEEYNFELFKDLDFSNAHDFFMYDFTHTAAKPFDNCVRIDLASKIKDEDLCTTMQQNVRELFNIDPSDNSNVIFFDQYLGLIGVLNHSTEKMLIHEICETAHPYGLSIKTHPGEINPLFKFYDEKASFLSPKDAPWEAIYFVNYYNKNPHKLVLITYASTALLKTQYMFEPDNIYYIFLYPIVRNVIQYERKNLFLHTEKVLNNNKLRNVSIINSFVSLEKTLSDIFDKPSANLNLVSIDECIFEYYKNQSKRMRDFLPNHFSGFLLEAYLDDTFIGSTEVAHPFDTDKFFIEIEIDVQMQQGSSFRLITHNNFMLFSMHIDKAQFRYENGSVQEISMSEFCSENSDTVDKENFYFYGYSLYRFKNNGLPNSSLIIEGSWKYKRIQAKRFEDEKSELLTTVKSLQYEKSELSTTVESLQNEKSELSAIGENLQNEKSELTTKVNNLHNEKSELLAKIDELKNDYSIILESKSWKLTSPLRKAMRCLKK